MRLPSAPPDGWTWVFDLDNTLYPAASSLFPQIEQRIVEFVSTALALDAEAARALQKHYHRTYGATLRGLMVEHQVEAAAFLDHVHRIDLSSMTANLALAGVLGRLPGRKLIYTNGSAWHAERVCRQLGVWERFEAVFDIVAAGYLPKPAPAAYAAFLACHGVRPEAAIMVEDMPANLGPAAALGMVTVLVHGTVTVPGDHGDHIHHQAPDLTDWLDGVAARLGV